MKNWYRNLKKVITLMLLMLVLSACASQQKKEKQEIIVPVIAGLDVVYFPSVPNPEDVEIIPLDEQGNIVVDEKVLIKDVVIPFWYWNMILDYIDKTETAVTALYAAHPP